MSETAEQLITPTIIEQAMSYEEYRTMIDNLLNENKTTGSNHSEGMVKYTKMNVHRMNRLDKQTLLKAELGEALESVEQQWIWLVLTEAWCGDAAQNIPVIAKMADQTDNIELKLILRDEHLDIMDQYLTNGGRSIPKLICLDAETLEEIGSWGPRPKEAQEKAMKWKNDSEISNKEWGEKLHKWYADNRTEDIQEEFVQLIKEWI
ncbi:thioredoxin family protein [Aliifodinibius salicampi]|uniref:Thioredoxin family protein n=1 Tax=Fodinibius salicampi TaxID=1920655 RepID=A0ABT3PY29_9BACT|nr:thioredoxin family protein [Fodinibius salicampi]MCW9712752.1 thioredoxin family protein [Fodinibius salicampi]